MDPIGTAPPPDFSNVIGNSSSTAAPGDCAQEADDIGNAAGDLATAIRDFLNDKTDGRDVYQKAKEVSKQGGEAIDCVLTAADNDDPEMDQIFNGTIGY